MEDTTEMISGETEVIEEDITTEEEVAENTEIERDTMMMTPGLHSRTMKILDPTTIMKTPDLLTITMMTPNRATTRKKPNLIKMTEEKMSSVRMILVRRENSRQTMFSMWLVI